MIIAFHTHNYEDTEVIIICSCFDNLPTLSIGVVYTYGIHAKKRRAFAFVKISGFRLITELVSIICTPFNGKEILKSYMYLWLLFRVGS